MKKKHGIGYWILFAFLAIVFLLLVLYFTGVIYPASNRHGSGELNDWMGNIDGSKKISTINMPGTHDSGTQFIFPSYFLQDQDLSIQSQMASGFRYFDIRVALDSDTNDDLILIHSFGKCRTGSSIYSSGLRYSEICQDGYDFLSKHPSETLLFCVKAEKEDGDVSKVTQLVEKEISNHSDKWYVGNSIPCLDEVRGKIVFCPRFDSEYGMNFQWDDQGSDEVLDNPCEIFNINDMESLIVQDRYHYSLEDKWSAVKFSMMQQVASDDIMNLVFLSASYGKLPHPRGFATRMNKEFLQEEFPQGNYGVIIFDFATEELASKVISFN